VFASLASADFRRLWLSVAAANSGRWALILAVGWLLQTQTHSSLWVGASLFGLQGPSLLVAPLAGIVADRFPRTGVLSLALATAGAGSAALAVLAWRHQTSLPAVLGLTLLVGVAAAFQSVSWAALLPNIVGPRALLNGVALQGIARQGSEFVGPALAAPILAVAGPWAVFALCALLWGTAALQPLFMRRTEAGQRLGGRDFLLPFRQGLRYVRAASPLGLLVAVVSLHCCLTMAFMGILPGFLQAHIGGGSAVYGAAMTALGLGAILGALPLTTVRDMRLRGRLYLISGLLSGATLLLFGLMRTEAAALALALTVGASQAMFMALTATAVQERCADAYRGRVSSVYTWVTVGAMATFNWSYGALGTLTDPARIMVATGGVFAIAFAVFVTGSPTMRHLCALGPAPAAAAAVALAGGETG